MTAPDGSERMFDNNPAVMVPHEYNMGYDGMFMDEEKISYPPGFDDTVVSIFFWFFFIHSRKPSYILD
jgi:hypothetical protein